MNVVVVESPAKARTIGKYLGPDFTVLASYGHVRDLPPKDGSVRPDEDFAMSWQVAEKSDKHLEAIVSALKGADALFLATDPDREGEAISWHVQEELAQRKVLDNVDVKRVVFHSVTKAAVLDAMQHPRDVNNELVEAYLARRALDYLVGFTLSPVLWRKLPGSKSAGRVQSVALRLICEREAEIEVFRPREYWTVEADFQAGGSSPFIGRLTHLNGEKLDKFALSDEAAAKAAADAVAARNFTVTSVERKRVQRKPQPPFTTSSLQQEASRKLGFGASRTMRTAQQLYEGVDLGGERVGLITYMRTDSVTLDQEALDGCRRLIGQDYGQPYLPDEARIYKTKSKNAQEAHEAVRPTDLFRRPAEIADFLDADQRKLYELIWRRTVASQMENAAMDQVAVDLSANDGQVVMRANGSVVAFDGFLKIYEEGRDDAPENGEAEARLPNVSEGQAVDRGDVRPEQHFTQPPPRYTEASLVKRLEELGIGRPSTYASIIQVLQDRDYVELDKRRFVPEDRGRVVTAFLSNFFARYVEYSFTADLEALLDDISDGRVDWKTVLRDFWFAFKAAVDDTKDLKISDVLDALDEDLGPHFFPEPTEDDAAEKPIGAHGVRSCPNCEDGRLGLKLGKFGAFIGCSNYPECRYTRKLAVNGNGASGDDGITDKQLGVDPATDLPVHLKRGPYGPYVQLGDVVEKGEKPKRVSLPKDIEAASFTFEFALKLLALPREVGAHPETGDMISAGIGRYGPYLRMGSTYASLQSTDDVLNIGLNHAVTILAEAKTKKGNRGGATALREMGDHPEDGKPVRLMSGRYGPYVSHAKVNASLPKDRDPEELTMDEAVALLAARRAKGPAKSKRKANKKTNKKSGAAAGGRKQQAASASTGD